MHARPFASILMAMFCAGCASVPPSPTRQEVATELAARADLSIGTLPEPSEAWAAPPGTDLSDGVSMDEAVSAALWNNPDFQVALSSLGLARADLVEAGLIKNPILSLLFPVGPKQLEWTVSWPVDVLWQRPRRIEAARIAADAVAKQLVTHGLDLIAAVKLAWIDLDAADLQLTLAEEQAAIARQLSALAEGRLRAGDISEFEARVVRTDAARLEASRVALAATRARADVRLRSLMGLGPERQPLELEARPSMPNRCGDTSILLETALAARPDVRGAELQLEAAGARVGLERSRVMTLSALLDANAKGSEGFEIGPGLAVELPGLSRNDGAKARAAAELQQAARRYVAARAAVETAVEDAHLRFEETTATVKLYEGVVSPSLDVGRRQAERLYEAGEISLLDLLEARRRFVEAEVSLLDATSAQRRSLIALEHAIGGSCPASRGPGVRP